MQPLVEYYKQVGFALPRGTETRHNMTVPQIDGRYVVATDGHRMVVTKLEENVELPAAPSGYWALHRDGSVTDFVETIGYRPPDWRKIANKITFDPGFTADREELRKLLWEAKKEASAALAEENRRRKKARKTNTDLLPVVVLKAEGGMGKMTLVLSLHCEPVIFSKPQREWKREIPVIGHRYLPEPIGVNIRHLYDAVNHTKGKELLLSFDSRVEDVSNRMFRVSSNRDAAYHLVMPYRLRP